MSSRSVNSGSSDSRGSSLLCSALCAKLVRTKNMGLDALSTPLRRCLSTLELTLLSLGSMVGAGLYVLTGTVAHDIVGPGIVAAFLLAGVVALLSGLCYAEFGARIPKAGSAYVYTYVTVGELLAFVIAWNMILEYVIGAAAVARAWSGYVDYLAGYKISNWTNSHLSMGNIQPFADSPDLVACGLMLLVMLFIGLGAQVSAHLNTILTLVNMMVVAFIVCSGLFLVDLHNWMDHGGFIPNGWKSVMQAASSCFFAFVGFDVVGNVAEEVQDPARGIPVAICVSLFLAIFAYTGVSGALTLMVPWTDISPKSALPSAFKMRGWGWAGTIIAVGALCAMSASLVTSLFAMPRCVYAMAADGLFYHSFAKVNERTQTPVLATIVFGTLGAITTMLFNLRSLVEFMSIGTLLAYTVVAASLIVTRYQSHFPHEVAGLEMIPPWFERLEDSEEATKARARRKKQKPGRLKESFYFLGFLNRYEPGHAVTTAVLIMAMFQVGLAIVLFYGIDAIQQQKWWALTGVTVFSVGFFLSLIVIGAHQQNRNIMTFKVPFVPLFPAISMFCNIYLMIALQPMTWVRFGVWMIIGFLVYFSYGIRYSRAQGPDSGPQSPYLIVPKRKMYKRSDVIRVSQPPSYINDRRQLGEEDSLIPGGGSDSDFPLSTYGTRSPPPSGMYDSEPTETTRPRTGRQSRPEDSEGSEVEGEASEDDILTVGSRRGSRR
ncbi:cationic amino acid transporter 4-like [Branchiostoma floridae x Branchiostoma belcheri]